MKQLVALKWKSWDSNLGLSDSEVCSTLATVSTTIDVVALTPSELPLSVTTTDAGPAGVPGCKQQKMNS